MAHTVTVDFEGKRDSQDTAHGGAWRIRCACGWQTYATGLYGARAEASAHASPGGTGRHPAIVRFATGSTRRGIVRRRTVRTVWRAHCPDCGWQARTREYGAARDQANAHRAAAIAAHDREAWRAFIAYAIESVTA